jgi:hypothetical protein
VAPRCERLRRAATATGLVVSSLVLTLGAAELGLRLWVWWRSTDAHPVGPLSAYEADAENLPVLQGLFELGRPNQRGIYRGAVHRTNSAGFRGRELTEAKPPGVFRVAVIGDSITMGSGVREDDTYPVSSSAS